MNLVILGNGFDLAHGMKTKYSNFKEYLAGKPSYVDLLETLNDLYCQQDLWGDFEYALGFPNAKFIATVEELFGIKGMFDGFAKELHDAFFKWVESVNDKQAKQKPQFGLSECDEYFVFNYTHTLELSYSHIDTQRIRAIHGRVIDELFGFKSIIYGHLYRKGDECAQVLLDATTKDVPGIIAENADFFDRISAEPIDTVKVFGCSYSDIDYPYFEKINMCLPNAHWIFGCNNGRDFDNAKRYAKRLETGDNSYTIIDSNGVFELKGEQING